MHMRLRTKYPYSCKILIKVKFLDRFSKNPTTTHFIKKKNCALGGRFVPCGRKDGRTDRHMTKSEPLFAILRKRLKSRLSTRLLYHGSSKQPTDSGYSQSKVVSYFTPRYYVSAELLMDERLNTQRFALVTHKRLSDQNKRRLRITHLLCSLITQYYTVLH